MPYILQRVLHSNVGEELLSVEIKNRCKYRRTRSYVAHFTPCFRPTRHSLICNFWMTKTDKLRPFVNTLIASWLVLPLRYLPLDNSNMLYYQRSSYSAKSAFGTYLYYSRWRFCATSSLAFLSGFSCPSCRRFRVIMISALLFGGHQPRSLQNHLFIVLCLPWLMILTCAFVNPYCCSDPGRWGFATTWCVFL
jgi:hypothetical protein